MDYYAKDHSACYVNNRMESMRTDGKLFKSEMRVATFTIVAVTTENVYKFR